MEREFKQKRREGTTGKCTRKQLHPNGSHERDCSICCARGMVAALCSAAGPGMGERGLGVLKPCVVPGRVENRAAKRFVRFLEKCLFRAPIYPRNVARRSSTWPTTTSGLDAPARTPMFRGRRFGSQSVTVLGPAAGSKVSISLSL